MRVTIVPEDSKVIIDGESIDVSLPVTANTHAIQWYGTHGTIERKQGGADHFTDESVIQPFVNAFLAEKQRLADEAEAARLAAEAAAVP